MWRKVEEGVPFAAAVFLAGARMHQLQYYGQKKAPVQMPGKKCIIFKERE
jgi:hypothetical protein